MIKYNLKCEHDHEFESWFSNSKEFEKLKIKTYLNVYIVLRKINKSIMAPNISYSSNKQEQIKMDIMIKKEKNELLKLRKYIEKNFNYVGKDLAK